MIDDGVASQIRNSIADDLQRETEALRKQLAEKEAEAVNNSNAARILTEFINQGSAEVNDQGEVRLVPNRIKNDEEES